MDKAKRDSETERRTINNLMHGHYGTPARLRIYRKKAADTAAKNPNYTAGADWRYHAQWGTKSMWRAATIGTRKGEGRELRVLSDNLDDIGECLGDADDIIRMDHTGYYADHFCSALMKGAVCRLRTSRGTYYIPATYCTEWDGVTHYLGDAEIVPRGSSEEDHETAKREAARSSDHYAEREAEESRDYYAKDAAEQDILTAREEIHDINKKALPLIREIKAAGQFTPAVCAALREKLADYLEERRDRFETIEKRTENYWSAVEGY